MVINKSLQVRTWYVMEVDCMRKVVFDYSLLDDKLTDCHCTQYLVFIFFMDYEIG